jgi:diguanylate cyclase (GGDEF)-like protein
MNSEPANKMCVLVVEDDPVATELLRASLAFNSGVNVLDAPDGQAALELMETAPVQIVFSDLQMPRMDGLELCRRVRAMNDRFRYFVMLTVHNEKPRLIEAFQAGVDDFLSKPFDVDEVDARLRVALRIVRLQDDLLAANRQLRLQASTDDLTGLYNRRQATARLAEQWALATRYGHPLSCLMIDVDRFKAVNDTHGHDVGDEVLGHLAKLFRQTLRQSDMIFRMGGEEFMVLLPHQDRQAAAACGERCRQAVVDEPAPCAGGNVSVTISVGLACLNSHHASPEQLLRSADRALYAAKAAGRNAMSVAPET